VAFLLVTLGGGALSLDSAQVAALCLPWRAAAAWLRLASDQGPRINMVAEQRQAGSAAAAVV
jgi:hypothetical protein